MDISGNMIREQFSRGLVPNFLLAPKVLAYIKKEDFMFDFYPEVNLSREELLAKIKAQMSEKRFQHILGVESSSCTC